jgi:hypothetical protein
MASFEDYWKELSKEFIKFAETSWKDYSAAAKKDGEAFLQKSKADLERWTKLVAAGGLTRDDFEWLLIGKKDVAVLVSLKEIGLAKVALDRFVNGVIDIIVSTTFKVFL